MENYDFNPAKEAKDVKDIEDAVKKIAALQRQINNPTRDGMINALSDAQSTAGKEIQQLEYSQGDTIPTPWVCFRDQDLYRKLSQYQDGLRQHCIKKVGEKAFEEMLKEAAKRADKRLGGQLEEPKEEIVFSEEHERKVEKLFRLERQKSHYARALDCHRKSALMLGAHSACSARNDFAFFGDIAFKLGNVFIIDFFGFFNAERAHLFLGCSANAFLLFFAAFHFFLFHIF